MQTCADTDADRCKRMPTEVCRRLRPTRLRASRARQWLGIANRFRSSYIRDQPKHIYIYTYTTHIKNKVYITKYIHIYTKYIDKCYHGIA